MQDRGESAPVLMVTELTKVYRGWKSVTAVDHITFELGRGEILGLLGPNGAGEQKRGRSGNGDGARSRNGDAARIKN